uniref:DH domain-containing protein n=2 Tax=Pygocentrus nattereri TaxID=42514 RepID=A0AAR2JZE9_PYGNA
MGTKRANWTIEDPSQLSPSPATPDRSYRSNEWISREARPQAGTKIRADRDREGEVRRAREMDRILEKAKGGRREEEQELREREMLTAFKARTGETEWRERERRRDEGRHSNGRIASVQEYSDHREREREKGDTFPRTGRQSNEREGRTRLSVDQSNERLMERGMGRLKELDQSESERERERVKKRDRDMQRYRETERQRENERARIREVSKRDGGRRLEKEDSDRKRGRGWDLGRRERRGERNAEVNDQQIMRLREVDRERERDRLGYRDIEKWLYSLQRDRIMEGESGNLSDREQRGERNSGWRRERHRHTKSEGDSDGEKEREVRRKETSEHLRYDQSKSERDIERERTRERWRERERCREMEWQRERDRNVGRERETDMLGNRERDKEWVIERHRERDMRDRDWVREERGPERQRGGVRDTQDRRRERESNERARRDQERYTQARPYASERVMDVNPERREMERRRSWEVGETTESSQTQSEAQRKVQVEAQSSGEWMSRSDVEHEQRMRERKDSFEDKERESQPESDREKKKKKINEEGQDATSGQGAGEAREGSEKEETETERDRDREKPESKQRQQRKMWLEPRSGRVRTESLEEEFRERERARERYAQRFKVGNASGEEDEMYNLRYERETEDRYRQLESAGEFTRDVDQENVEERRKGDEGRLDTPWQMETENVGVNMEGTDREEERGSGRSGDSEGEEGSEWELRGEGRERVTSADDGFVTVSSGGDEDEAEEDKFEDCKEFWDGGVREDLTRQSPTRTHQSEGEIETKMIEERSDRTVTVFCVVGQTLPRSGSNQLPHLDPMEQEDAGQHSAQELGGGSDVDQDVALPRDTEGTDESVKESYDLTLSEKEITNNHTTKGEKTECDEMNKEVTSAQNVELTGSVCAEKEIESHPQESSETLANAEDQEYAQKIMTDEESRKKEETHNTEGERKRYSAAPHVKWAKNVLKEILGSSDDGVLSMPEPGIQTEQPSDRAPAEAETQGESPASPLYGIVQKPCKHSIERKCIDPELLQCKPEDTESGSQLDTQGNKILIQVDRESETEEELDHLEQDKEMLEEDTDEEDNYDRLLPSPDLHSFSSEGEAEKEGSGKKDKKQKKKKTAWDFLSSSSFRDFGNEARARRKGFRKVVEKQSEDEEGEGIARDRRPRVFTTEEDEYDDLRHSFNESELRNFKARISRTRMRNSKFYNSQLYQQYNEVVQNREILHQSHSDASSVFQEIVTVPQSSSPCPSPPPARRPLPPLPSMLHPHSLSHTNSSRPLAIPQHTVTRPLSPRLSRSSSLLWQELPGVSNNPELQNLSEDERRLQEVRFEVVTSEASYCSSLDIVVEHFVKSKQLNSLLATQDKNWLFSRLGDVRAISNSFFSQLEERVESDVMHFTVCDIIIKHCPRFRAVYVPYLTNQSYQDKTYQRLMNENAGFRNIVEKLEHSPKCQRLPLRSFLILPFQRITRLKLLVQNIVKRTAPKTKDEAQAIKAMKLLEKMIQESNDSITQMKSIESLVSLNAKVDFECKTLPLISQSRRLVREGLVTELRDFSLKETERSVYIHLFNDYLLLSLPKEGGRFTVIDHTPVSELRAENCRVKLHSLQKNLFRLHMGHKVALLLRTETQADKLRWISAISRPHPEIDFGAAQGTCHFQSKMRLCH